MGVELVVVLAGRWGGRVALLADWGWRWRCEVEVRCEVDREGRLLGEGWWRCEV